MGYSPWVTKSQTWLSDMIITTMWRESVSRKKTWYKNILKGAAFVYQYVKNRKEEWKKLKYIS